MGEDLDNGGMMGYTTDQFLRVLEETLNERNPLEIINDGTEPGEFTWSIDVPANLSGDNVTGEPNPWNYRKDILPIMNLSDKSLSLILKTYFEIMMEDDEVERTEEDIHKEIRKRINKIFNDEEERSGKYFI